MDESRMAPQAGGSPGPLTRPAPLNLHFQHLAYLREVARQGSLTRAAEVLHVSQPALSQALGELERRLGIVLFERAGRQRRLTAAGQEIVGFAEQVLAQAAALQRRLDAQRSGEGGSLRVGMIDAASLYVLPDVVRRYREAYPGVDLRVAVATSGELTRRLRSFELDLAFVVGPVEEPDLRSSAVQREPLHVYAPPDDAGDGQTAHWVLYPEGSRTRRIIDEAFARVGLRPAVTLESGNPAVLRQMVAMGLGWSVLPPAVAEAGHSVVRLQRGEQLAERPLHAVWRRAGPPDPRVEAFARMALAGGSGAD